MECQPGNGPRFKKKLVSLLETNLKNNPSTVVLSLVEDHTTSRGKPYNKPANDLPEMDLKMFHENPNG